ncbi:hypothetical protein [uncultured Mediterranean phage uvMED]|nr:hypothetical protein [uncultured Mediterranean phage uvMED]
MNNKDYFGHMRDQEKAILSCSYEYYRLNLKYDENISLKYVEDSRINYKKDPKFCEIIKELKERKEQLRIEKNEIISNKEKR